MALPIDQQPSQVGTYEKILTIANRIMNGGEITKEKAIELIHTSDDDTMILLAMADKIRQHFNDNSVDVCAIVNARSGKCPENCKFCAQSAHHNTGVQEYPFMDEESILQAARIALAFKSVFRSDTFKTMVFDEIDVGISGDIALKVAEKILHLSKTNQVFCITHLPQTASIAKQHYHLAKIEQDDRTVSTLSVLNEEERVTQIASMMSGRGMSSTALAAAKELIDHFN